MEKLIRNYVTSDSLSDKDLMKLIENKARLVTHDRIGNFRDLDELLGKYRACVILYVNQILPSDDAYGHWCAVFEDGRGQISYFDPYGFQPDFSLTRMSPQAIQEYGNEPVLSDMLHDWADKSQGRKVYYNTYPLQEFGKNISDCGRWTGLRLIFRNLDGNQFAKFMTQYTDGMSPDDLVSVMTSFLK